MKPELAELLAYSASVSSRMQALARRIEAEVKKVMNRGKPAGTQVLFCTFVFTENPAAPGAGYASYVSNAEREDIRKVLRHFLDRWEAGEDDTPLHELGRPN